MNILGKGSKPVVYKSNIKLQFYGNVVDDCRVNIDHIYVKLMPDETAVVFGDYTYFLLYSYKDNSGQIMHFVESKSIIFTESFTYQLDNKVNQELFDPKPSFEPHISFKRAASNAFVWEIEIEGEIGVTLYGDENVSEDVPLKDENVSEDVPLKDENVSEDVPLKDESSFENSATVMQLNNLGIPVSQLLEMDTAAINKLIMQKSKNTLSPLSSIDSEQTPSVKNKTLESATTEIS